VIILRIDWKTARRWYTLGGDSPDMAGKPNKATGVISMPSLEEIANFYQVHPPTVRNHCRKEGWVATREFQQLERDKKITERLQEMQIKSLSEVNAENYKIASAVQSKFLEQLMKDKTTVYAGDALAWSKLKQEVAEKASGIEEDNNDAYKDFVNRFINKKKGD
jgi:hypothetical protein